MVSATNLPSIILSPSHKSIRNSTATLCTDNHCWVLMSLTQDVAAIAGPKSEQKVGSKDPDIQNVEDRASAVRDQREALRHGGMSKFSDDKESLIQALQGLTCEYQMFADEQSLAIARLRSDVREAKQSEESHSTKVTNLEAGLRKAIEKNVEGVRSIDTLNEKIMELERDVSVSNKETREALDVIHQKDAELDELRSSLSESNAALRAADSDLKERSQLISFLKEELKGEREQMKLLNGKYTKQAQKFKSTEEELSSAREDLARSNEVAVAQNREISDLRTDIQNKENTATQELANIQTRLQDVCEETSGKVKVLEKELKDAKESASTASQEFLELNQKFIGLEATLKERDTLHEENLATVRKLQESLASSEELLAESRQECLSLQTELSNLQDTCTNYASAIALATHQLGAVSPSKTENSDPDCQVTPSRTPLSETQLVKGCPPSERGYVISGICNAGKRQNKSSHNSKFKFRVDVPAFQPARDLACSEGSELDYHNYEMNRETNYPNTILDNSVSVTGYPVSIDSMFTNLFWCPPGTTTRTLASTVYPDVANACVVDVSALGWADGATMWGDILHGLRGGENAHEIAPVEDSQDFWSSLETLFLSLADFSASAFQNPILFVLRGATPLSAAKLKDIYGVVESDACERIIQFVELLSEIGEDLASGGLVVTVILEGWQSSVPVGRHFAQSLALPRVSRRSGKRKHANSRKRRTQIYI